MKKRIWELDALRGICILGMVLLHLTYDLIQVFRVWNPEDPWLYNFGMDWCGIIFFLLSGTSATLGSHPVKRGLQVFGGGMLCTAATLLCYLLGFLPKSIIIYFGVLHSLGTCMLLWALFRKLPRPALGILGVAIIALGLYLRTQTVSHPYLILFGLCPGNFSSSDYFPILPNLGYFLVGVALGGLLYRKKTTLLPRVKEDFFLLRFFRFCGRHSLAIYLIHQPVLYGLLYVILFLF